MKRYYIFFAILSAICLLAIGGNALLRRNPVHDARLVDDLRTLQPLVDNYYLSQDQLPDDLAQVSSSVKLKNPLNNYQYTQLSGTTYQLCATFRTDTTSSNRPVVLEQADPGTHGKGRQCFNYRVLPIRDYPYGR